MSSPGLKSRRTSYKSEPYILTRKEDGLRVHSTDHGAHDLHYTNTCHSLADKVLIYTHILPLVFPMTPPSRSDHLRKGRLRKVK